MNKIFILLFLTIYHIVGAQLGINTDNPQKLFHVDGAKDNPISGVPTEVQSSNDVFFDQAGRLSAGNLSPVAKVEARNTSGLSAVAIGSTDQTAAEAEEGAMQYISQSGGKIAFSDGTDWRVISSAPKKIYVKAKSTSTDTFVNTQTTNITSWDFTPGYKTYYTTNNVYTDPGYFNAVTGVFTAPRSGVYSASIFITLDKSALEIGGINIIWQNTSVNNGTDSYNCRKETGGASVSGVLMGISCTVQVIMEKNDNLRPMLLNQTGHDKTLLSDNMSNVISIIEL